MTPRLTKPLQKIVTFNFKTAKKARILFFKNPIAPSRAATRPLGEIVHLKSFGISPDRRSKQAFSNRHFFTLIHADNLRLLKRRTRRFHAPNRETRPDRVQQAGPLSKNLKSLESRDAIMRISPLYATTTWSMSK